MRQLIFFCCVMDCRDVASLLPSCCVHATTGGACSGRNTRPYAGDCDTNADDLAARAEYSAEKVERLFRPVAHSLGAAETVDLLVVGHRGRIDFRGE